MTDNQELSTTEVVAKRSLRPNATWKSGEKLPFSYNPSVEGMVVATRWVDEAFMVVFLVPPFKKEGGTWAEASLAYKTANTMIKEPLLRYDYPFPKDYRIVREVNQANGNVEVLQEIVAYINKMYPPPAPVTVTNTAEPVVTPWGSGDAEATSPPPINDDRLSLHMLLSQHDESPMEEQNQLPSYLKI